jgi:hypothetical protein
VNLNVQVKKILLKRKVVNNTSRQLSQARVPPKDAQLKGKIHRHTQPQVPNNEEASKGCTTQGEDSPAYTTTSTKQCRSLQRMHNFKGGDQSHQNTT